MFPLAAVRPKGSRPQAIAAVGGGAPLLTGETNGWATDFLHPVDVERVALKTSGTVVESGLSFFTQNSTSSKWVFNAAGTLVNIPAGTLALDYDPVTHAAKGMLRESQATNLCLQSSDFTNASWVKTTMTTAKTATGPDGVANSASTLTASAANATALQAITSASSVRVTAVFLKRRTGSGSVQLTQDNGSTWTTQALTTSWVRYALASVTSTNPTVGIRLVTSSDAVDVALFQHEAGSSVATSPIPTLAATVTRPADQIAIAPAQINFSATAGSWWVDLEALSNTGNSARVIGYSAGQYTPIYQQANEFRCYEPTVTLHMPVSPMVGLHKVAIAFQTIEREMSADGLPTDFISWATPTVFTNDPILIGIGYNPQIPDEGIYGYIRKVRYVPRRKSASELRAETT